MPGVGCPGDEELDGSGDEVDFWEDGIAAGDEADLLV